MALLEDLIQLVNKYGYDPKNGHMGALCSEKACGVITSNESGLCYDCERKEATE